MIENFHEKFFIVSLLGLNSTDPEAKQWFSWVQLLLTAL